VPVFAARAYIRAKFAERCAQMTGEMKKLCADVAAAMNDKDKYHKISRDEFMAICASKVPSRPGAVVVATPRRPRVKRSGQSSAKHSRSGAGAAADVAAAAVAVAAAMDNTSGGSSSAANVITAAAAAAAAAAADDTDVPTVASLTAAVMGISAALTKVAVDINRM